MRRRPAPRGEVAGANKYPRANRPARRSASRLAQTRKGTRAPKRCDRIFIGSLSAPASVACRAEGAITSSARFGPTRCPPPGPRRQDLRHLRPHKEQRAPLRYGRPCVPLLAAHSPDPRPRNPRELLLASAAATVRRLPQPGHRLGPAKPLSCCVPMEQGGASMRAACSAGTNSQDRSERLPLTLTLSPPAGRADKCAIPSPHRAALAMGRGLG